MKVVRDQVSERLWTRYAEIARLRAFEEVVAEAAKVGTLGGLLHLAIGGEAATVGIFENLCADDRVYVAHRPHQQFLAGGADPFAVLAELAGREGGICRGRGGSIHMMSDQVVMATGIVGGTLSIAVGHALRVGDGNAVVVIFGDGAVQTGAFHESVNLAGLWKVPVLFVCENNGWIEFSSREEHTTVGAVADYGRLYGIRSEQVDGADVDAVSDIARSMLSDLRVGQGPALLEVFTKRLRPHYEGDFRDGPAEVDFMDGLQERLVDLGYTKEDVMRVYEGHLETMQGILMRVLESPMPDPADDESLVFARQLP